jgi:hypothetical protein
MARHAIATTIGSDLGERQDESRSIACAKIAPDQNKERRQARACRPMKKNQRCVR